MGKPAKTTPEDDDIGGKWRVYLSKVYRLADFAGDPRAYIGTSTLADALMVTAPAVNRMVNRLKENGLLYHEPYKGIALTDEGWREALRHLRVHRIIEAFLVNVVKMDWSVVNDEANRLSLGTSDLLLARMNDMAGNPTHCPHGEPIPAADGTLLPMQDIPLVQVAPPCTVRVTRMRTREPDRLKYIEALGLMPNTTLDVLHVAPFHGPMQLKINREYRIIGSNLAELIRVEKL
jgi:DtxR family Mn-dependent transcriptional regulator